MRKEKQMADDEKTTIENTDETLLLVKGSSGDKGEDREYVKKLANAILQVFSKHGEAKLRCVGAASLNNAVKACIVASGEAEKKGEGLVIDPSFTTVKFCGEEKTGIILQVLPE
jgi:stage V sporulation protein SpoVS